MQRLGQKQGPPLPTIHAVFRNDVNVSLIVVIYLALSICNIFTDDYLTTASEYKSQYPLFTVLLQLVTALVLIQLLKWCQSRRNPWFLRFYSLSRTGWKEVLPASGIYALIVLVDIQYLMRVPSTIYTSMYASCVSVTLALGMLFAQKKYRRRRQRGQGHWMATFPVWSSCLVQCLGVWFAGAADVNTISWVTGAGYPLLLAMYGYSIQKALVNLKNDVSQFVQWHLILSILGILAIILALGDFSAAYQFILTVDQVDFWTQTVLGSAIFLSLHILIVLLVNYTSPLSYAVSLTAKACIQSIIVLCVVENKMSRYPLVCLLISLVGAALYSKTSVTEHIDTVYSM